MMGYAAQRVEVWAVIAANGEQHVTVPAEIEVPAMGTPVHYDFLPVPWVRSGLRNLVLDGGSGNCDWPLSCPACCPTSSSSSAGIWPCRWNRTTARSWQGFAGRPMNPDTPLRELVESGRGWPILDFLLRRPGPAGRGPRSSDAYPSAGRTAMGVKRHG